MHREASRIWDGHIGVTAVPDIIVGGGTRERKGDAYANSMVVAGFSGEIPAKIATCGLAAVAAIPRTGDGRRGHLPAHRERLSRRDNDVGCDTDMDVFRAYRARKPS